jgi:multiple RNA-binding domain-containing protein 1
MLCRLHLISCAAQGRLIHLLPAKPPPAAKLAEGRGVAGRTEFQRQKEAKKRQVSSQEEAWNALFLRTDTVLEATAARHGLAKGELLDVRDPGSLAVRAALSETAIIQETKRVLEREGVDLDQVTTH